MTSSILPHDDRRKHPRFIADNAYTLTIQGERYAGKIGNISEGGAYLYLENVTPKMTEKSLFRDGEITLELPTADVTVKCSISFVGTEHSKNVPGIGIAFVDTDEEAATLISQFIETIK
ncbi:MAG: PilZ domain-containing protein [Methylococcales bacterium]|nr:PilZ domain-containing protein [Methylococcales bacterium]